MSKLGMYVNIDTTDLFESVLQLDQKHIMRFMLDLDLAVADTEFTEKLIKKLKKSLKNEESVQPVYAGNGYPQYEDQ